jgi:FMN phosphatase YigB (HAD superfamily)
LSNPPLGVTFDFGNTLVSEPDADAAPAARLRHLTEWLGRQGLSRAEDALAEAFAAAARAAEETWRADRRHVDAAASVARILAHLEVDSSPADQAPLITLLEDPLPGPRMAAVDGAAATLERLRSRGIRLGIVSNLAWGPGRVMRRQLEHVGLLQFFEPRAVAFSDEVGFVKPHPAIFEAALAGLETPPERAAHVGDLRLTDVAGAAALGIRTIRFAGIYDDTSDGPEADVVIERLSDVPNALGL